MKVNMRRPQVWYDEKGNPMDAFVSTAVQYLPPEKGDKSLRRTAVWGTTRMWVRYPDSTQWVEIVDQPRIRELARMNRGRESLADGMNITCRKRFVPSVTEKLPGVEPLPDCKLTLGDIPTPLKVTSPSIEKPVVKLVP